MQKRLPFSKSFLEIQRASPSAATWEKISALARQDASIVFCRIAPEYESPLPFLHDSLPSPAEHFPSATRLIDLTQTEAAILAGFSQTGRRHLRLAQKGGLECFVSTDTTRYAELAKITAQRDGFGSHNAAYFTRLLEAFTEDAFLLVVAKDDIWLAAGIFVFCDHVCTYYYGASDNEGREYQAATLLQWEAIMRAKAHDCHAFDLFGIAPEGDAAHRLVGVTRFKQKFGGTVRTYPPEVVIVFRPLWYRSMRLAKRLRSLLR